MMQLNNVAPEAAIQLPILMQMVHEALDLPSNVRWNSFDVFSPHLADFMKPATHIVEKLLDETSVKVAVYSGNLDLICATPGTVAWVNRLNWHGKEEFAAQRRIGFAVNDVLEGYFRRFGNLSMYWVSSRQSDGKEE
jgi:serine carboxypeptidase 1